MIRNQMLLLDVCVRRVPKEALLRAMQHSSIANRFIGNKIYNPTQLLIL
jgi:hypothetical protein